MPARRLRLDCQDDLGDAVAEIVGDLAGQAGLGQRVAYRLRLAVDEIATNIAAYGYRGQGGVVYVEAGYDSCRAWVTILDEAPPFDPRGHDPAPAVQGPPQEGGYGIFLAINGVDEFSYERVGGCNRNTLTVRRPVCPAADCADEGVSHGRQGRQDRARRR